MDKTTASQAQQVKWAQAVLKKHRVIRLPTKRSKPDAFNPNR